MLASCKTSGPAESEPETETTSGPPELPDHEDSGPILTRDTTPLEVKTDTGPSLQADRIATDQDIVFLRVMFPDDFEREGLPEPHEFGLRLRGMRLAKHRAIVGLKGHGVAAREPESGDRIGTEEPAMYLRIHADSPDVLDGSIQLRTVRFKETRRHKASDPIGHLVRRTWPIDVPDDLETDDTIRDLTYLTIAERLDQFGRTNGSSADEFLTYAQSRLEHLADSTDASPGFPPPRDDVDEQEWLEDAMGNMTGRQAIDETLQADQQLEAASDDQSKSLSASEIQPVELPEHPWDTILDDLDGDSDPQTESVARFAPSDRMYARFDSLEAFIGLLDDAGATLAPVLGSFADARALDNLAGRYEHQLGIDATVFAENFGDLAVNDVGLLLDDPYLASGTAVTVIFQTENPTVVNSFLDTQLSDARSNLEVDESTIEVRGRTVRVVESTARELSHVRVTVDDAVIVSNSTAPVEAILQTVEGDRPSIADSAGFKFMRHYYPVDERRTGFMYVGQDFVRRFTGPRYRIAQSRRSRARANLRSLHYLAMFRSWLDGAWPDDTDDLFADQQRNKHLTHADGADIAFDLNKGARSAWGRRTWMRPISEVELQGITKAERNAYRQFRRDYSNLGHEYIDPIGVALTERKGHTTFDVRVTPLHQESDYRQLEELVGDARLYEGPETTGLQWSFGIGEDADIRETLRQAATRSMFGEQVTIDWLGSWAALGIADRSGIWDGAVLFDSIPVRGEDPMDPRSLTAEKVRALDHFSGWLALEVQSQVGLAAFLGGIRQFLDQMAPNLVTWSTDDPYRETEITRIDVTFDRNAQQAASLHYTVIDGVFLMTFDRKTLEHRIDAVKAGYTPRPAPNLKDNSTAKTDKDTSSETAESKANRSDGDADSTDEPDGPQADLTIRTKPKDSWLLKTLFGLVDNAQTYGLSHLATNNLLAVQVWPSLSDNKLERRSKRWWGAGLRNHHGRLPEIGEYGGVVDPLYGILPTGDFWRDPPPFQKLPEVPVEPSPVTDWMKNLRHIGAEISFEDHADALGLHVRATFDWDQTDTD